MDPALVKSLAMVVVVLAAAFVLRKILPSGMKGGGSDGGGFDGADGTSHHGGHDSGGSFDGGGFDGGGGHS